MASKGQKFKKYSPEFKDKILIEYMLNKSATTLANQYDIPQCTIRTWLYNFRHDKVGGMKGRPKSTNLTLEDYKERYEILKKYQAFLQARRVKK